MPAQKTTSSYIRGDREISYLRSGDGVPCVVCGARPGERCQKRRSSVPWPILYNHHERRQMGRRAADELQHAPRGGDPLRHLRSGSR